MTSFLRTLPQTVVGVSLLTTITIFGYTGTLNASSTYVTFMAFLGLVGATGIWVLASTWSNTNAIPHLIIGVLSMAALVILGLHHTFTSDQLAATFGIMLTGSAAGGTAAVVTSMSTPTSPSQTGSVL